MSAKAFRHGDTRGSLWWVPPEAVLVAPSLSILSPVATAKYNYPRAFSI
jgi:hypothetical protein